MFLREPLLDSDIFTDLMIRVEMSPHHRVCAIGTDQIAGGNMLLPAVCTKNDMPFIILTPDFSAQAVVINLNAGGDQRFHPQVESMAINIDIASLVVTRERCGDVDGFDAENLRISDHIDRKRQPIANKDRCASGASRPPQGLLKPSVPHWCFLSSAITCILPANFRANADPAGPRPIIATSKCSIFSLTFITMAKDYCLKVKSL